MLIVQCRCGAKIESFRPEDIIKNMRFIIEAYITESSHKCKKCWISGHRMRNRLHNLTK